MGSNRKSKTEKAKDSDKSVTDRIQSAYGAAKEGAKETKESMKKKYEEQKADNAKDNIKGNDEGIIESATNYIKDTASSTSDYIKDTTDTIGEYMTAKYNQGEHRMNEEKHKSNRKSKLKKLKIVI